VEAALRELWLELRRTTANIQCRLLYKRDAPERIEVRRKLLDLRRRVRAHARALCGGGLELLEASSSQPRPKLPYPRGGAADGNSPAPSSLEDLRMQCPIYTATAGCRHLCEHLCYFREYEPARHLQTLRKRAALHPLRPSVEGWTARLALAHRPPFWAVVIHDAAGAVRGAPREAWQSLADEALAAPLAPPRPTASASPSPAAPRQTDGGTGIADRPTTSPFGLIEELLADEPWQLLVTCFLLNKTGRESVDRVLATFFRRWPVAADLVGADVDEIGRLLEPLGLHRKRSRMLVRFSREYLDAVAEVGSPLPVARLRRLHGVGRYACDAYRIFVRGEVGAVRPTDVYLGWFAEYHTWRSTSDEHGGAGEHQA